VSEATFLGQIQRARTQGGKGFVKRGPGSLNERVETRSRRASSNPLSVLKRNLAAAPPFSVPPMMTLGRTSSTSAPKVFQSLYSPWGTSLTGERESTANQKGSRLAAVSCRGGTEFSETEGYERKREGENLFSAGFSATGGNKRGDRKHLQRGRRQNALLTSLRRQPF